MIIPHMHRYPECVLDNSGAEPVIRCTRCGGTRPTKLPRSLKTIVEEGEAFRQEHRYCHLGLAQLRENELALLNMERKVIHGTREYFKAKEECEVVRRTIGRACAHGKGPFKSGQVH